MSGAQVLMLSAHHPEVDRRILLEATALTEAGHRVSIVSVPAAYDPHYVSGDVEMLIGPRKRQPRLESVGRAVHHVIGSRLPAGFGRAVRERLIPERRHQNRWTDFLTAASPDRQWDVIHCHDLSTLAAGVRIAGRARERPAVVYDSHELYPHQFTRAADVDYWSRREADLMPHVDRVITVNPSIAALLAEWYTIDTPTVIYNAPRVERDVAEISEREFTAHVGPIPAGSTLVVYHGNYSRDRNLEPLVDALALLPSRFHLVMFGRGPLEHHLTRRSRRAGSADRVHIAAYLPQHDLLGYLRHCDLGVVPYPGSANLNNYYCTPNKLFDYLEIGLPLCANRLPELTRIIEGEGIGSTFPMNDPQEIAHAISTAADRHLGGHLEEVRSAGRRALATTYGWDAQAATLLDLYTELMADRARGLDAAAD